MHNTYSSKYEAVCSAIGKNPKSLSLMFLFGNKCLIISVSLSLGAIYPV